MKARGFVFRKGMDVKVSNRKEGISIMKRGVVAGSDWPFVCVKIDGTEIEEWFFRNDIFPLHYYTC
jgi:hypothetical protein